MSSKWLSLINFALAGLAISLLIFSGGLYFLRPWSIATDEAPPPKKILPQSAFARPEQEYEEIRGPFLELQSSSYRLQLPDLSRHLVYYGQNTRPDADPRTSPLHFGIAGDQGTPATIAPQERLFLVYDSGKPRGGYAFSPENAQTSLWIKADASGGKANIQVGMLSDQGEIIQEPKSHAKFSLSEKEFVRTRATPWEIGKWKVDGTLLARQRARWWGKDLFMEKHGGDEYADLAGKQRIDFGEKEEKYSIYLGLGDSAVWDGKRWKAAVPGPDTRNAPLLVVKKIEDRLMSLELWDPSGAFKIPINLLRSTQAWLVQNLEKSFKFVGARTRSQFVFELKGERILLRPQDWLLFTDNEWKKITTSKQIDDYVELRTPGVLFVFEGITQKEGQQLLEGTMFNATRTETQIVALPIQQGSGAFSSVDKKEAEEEEFDLEDDEDSFKE